MYKAKSKVIVYTGNGGWRFLAIPEKQGKEIKKLFGKFAVGYGSIRVEATIGKTVWKTSIFPDKKSGSYLLPLKAEVRKTENIADGDTVQFVIKVV
jgi:hypothetical protein